MSDYPVILEQSRAHVRVTANGETLAETRHPLRVLEEGHGPVWYVPREDVRREMFEKTSHRTRCPWKGTATHWTIRAGGAEQENAAWTYESPKPQVAGLRGHFAFYPGQAEVQVEPED